MSKLIWMSDLHFTAKGEVLGHDPRVRLEAAVDHINTHHADAAVCVISGDLVNHGTAEDYAALGAALDDLSVPFFPMVGNHDNRGLLRSALPVPQGGMDEFVQYAVSTPAGLIVCLDTQKQGTDAGAFCPDRMGMVFTAETGARTGIRPHSKLGKAGLCQVLTHTRCIRRRPVRPKV